MLDHFGITCRDIATSAAFYDRVLGVLGHRRLMDYEVAIGYGTDKPDFWISAWQDDTPNRDVHIAFTAPDAEAVRGTGVVTLLGAGKPVGEIRAVF